jgi:hypothetical protein
MLISLILFSILHSLIYVRLVESQLVPRECKCERVYSFKKQKLVNLTTRVNLDESRDICDQNCLGTCSRAIRKELGDDEDRITPAGLEKICEHVTPDKSIFKDGISVYNRWNLNACSRGDHLLKDNICCRFCQCSLVYFDNLKSKLSASQTHAPTPVLVADLSENIFRKNNQTRAYLCTDLDQHEECERDCRSEVGKYFAYSPLTNHINVDMFDTLVNRADSNKICEKLNETHMSPGVNLVVRVESGRREEEEEVEDGIWHKDVHLGNICCNRTCECEIVYKRGNRTLNKIGRSNVFYTNDNEF